ncbi:MPPV-171 hypothetical protein [Magpiepox virus 2]|nr:MPPV-171 hypothetical protein [Magpiepox virus 2]
MIIEEKNNKTRCLNAISCDKFENSHGGLYYPDTEMLDVQMWIGSVNITDNQWNTYSISTG